jgi:hypothetical protein
MLRHRRVDPNGFGLFWWPGMPGHESFGMACIGAAQHGLAALDHGVGVAVVQDLGREQTDTAVPMLPVVPREEGLAEAASTLDRAEALRELRSILEGLELALREGVVVGDVRPAVGFGNAQVAEQAGHGVDRLLGLLRRGRRWWGRIRTHHFCLPHVFSGNVWMVHPERGE